MASSLDAHGTCLSRSLTLAARLRDAEVVIGVAGSSLHGRGSSFAAHAWVEMRGVPLRPDDAIPGEIVRICVRDKE
jgi:hypothetical protein